MSKITLEMKSDRINSIISDYCTQDDLKDIEKDSQEEMVDIRVFNLMETMYPDNIIVAQNKKNEPVYKLLKSKQHDGKRGRSDITLFNYFENNSIDIMIENKFDKTKGNPINEAIEYCNNINESGIYTCRVAVGFNLYDNSQLITKVLDENGNWSDLKINGKVINGFIGQEILQLIYSHAGVTEFDFKVKIEEKYTRGEFKKILDSDLPIIFRKMSDIASDDALKISFTIAFISLKVILEKQEDLKNNIVDEIGRRVVWRNSNEKIDLNSINALRNVNDIKLAVKAIVGDTASRELRDKYKDIFDLDKYTFNELIDKILKTEAKNKVSTDKSSIMKMKLVLDKIKRQTNYHYEFDLFGEVYESLANNKTKSDLGQYFTKRHIIRPLVNMMLRPNDLEGIINKYKKICDPFCGTGGMLTESFKHIRTYCNEKYPSLDTSEIAKKVIYGYDVIESNVGKTKINMTLAEDGYSVIEQRDSLTTLNQEECFDYIITNVPYGAGESDGIVHNISDVKVIKENDDKAKIINRIRTFERDNNTQKLEYNSLIKVVQLLKEGGKAIVIVPDGLLENPSFSKMREWLLVKCKIDMIISIPKYAFAPYTKEKTYALFLQKRISYDEEQVECLLDIPKDERIYAYILDNDGYANSDKQYETSLRDDKGVPKHNEVTEYFDNNGDFHISILEQICKSRQEDTEEHFNEWGEKINGKKYGYIDVQTILKDYYYRTEEEIESNKEYRLNLLPEKYLRPKEFENLTLEKLIKKREELSEDIKDLINEV
ncbi:MAG: class I SAM-dependent DNA methyltransferase [Bacilli bacterium]|jgi:type I restriction enzyme M protein